MSSKRQKSLGKRGEDALWHYGKSHEEHPGWDVMMLHRYATKAEQELKGDYRVQWEGRKINVDAKVEDLRSPNFPLEECQDTVTGSGGWFEKGREIDVIWYAQVDDNGQGLYGMFFHCIWRINLRAIRSHYDAGAFSSLPTTATDKGFGHTILRPIPFVILENIKAATLWWGQAMR